MGLHTAGACFLPYGFERQEDGTWVAFNREYFPLFVSVKLNLTNKKLNGIADDLRDARRDESNEIYLFFLYGDDSSPWSSKKAFREYSERLEALISIKTEVPPNRDSKVWENHWKHRKTSLKWNTVGRPAELEPPAPPPPPSRSRSS